MKRNWRIALALLHDVLACVAAWYLAYWLRFNLDIPEEHLQRAASRVPWIVPLNAAIFLAFGLYRGIWRFASLHDLKRIVTAVGVVAIVTAAGFLMARESVPRSVLIMYPLFLAGIMAGGRIAYRAWKERRLDSLIPTEREPVFVIGTGDAAAALVKELVRRAQWLPVGLFDEDGGKRGRQVHGVRVLGAFTDLEQHAERLGVTNAIIAMPEADHSTRRRAVEACRAASLNTLTVPSFEDLVSGRVTVSQVRHVELDDLLGRDPVVLDVHGLSEWISGRVVMVTGAAGSIGRELCRQIAQYGPSRLVLFEASEFGLYQVEQEFVERFPSLRINCAIGDVKDAVRVDQVMSLYNPSLVFHAAAYKHVPLMENENAWQAILNNVRGTQVVAEASIAHAVEKFVLISTDKAVNPTNVMGASKRLAELVCQALQGEGGTRFIVVRFGNVLGSTGSVVPRFREQIAKGGPITVTHPEIRRFFMSIPEAAQLVVQAGLMGTGGEIFVLDMGEAVKIADLARDMIRLSGLAEHDVQIVYTGLRPGEKLYEEVLADEETSLPTPHPKLRIARAQRETREWLDRLASWLDRTDVPDEHTVRSDLARWVPEYRANPHGAAQPA
ncbi:MAG TPA: nucleoside-diphosphate sugar epimerase/dehydratase [Burkholderiales bacterium]|nr:nucleoside-diphosphate sugar epimerase/dehydratase [Burkholderiales bacterium]